MNCSEKFCIGTTQTTHISSLRNMSSPSQLYTFFFSNRHVNVKIILFSPLITILIIILDQLDDMELEAYDHLVTDLF